MQIYHLRLAYVDVANNRLTVHQRFILAGTSLCMLGKDEYDESCFLYCIVYFR